MAVFTPVTIEQAQHFLASYDLGPLRSLTPIQTGVENTNFRAETGHGAFALTVFERRAEIESVPFLLSFAEHLDEQGLPIAAPVRDRSGRLFGFLAGKPAALCPWLTGTPIGEPTVRQAQAAGALLASMHHLGEGFMFEMDNPYGPARWRSLLARCREAGAGAHAGLLQDLEAELTHLAELWPQGLPQGAVHADYFPDNVMAAGDTVTGVIDFGYACTDCFAYDLAIALNAWGFLLDGTPAEAVGEAFLEGYEGQRTLSPAERDAMPALLRGAALRFTATRLHDKVFHDPDWLVSPKDPQAFFRRLAYWRMQCG